MLELCGRSFWSTQGLYWGHLRAFQKAKSSARGQYLTDKSKLCFSIATISSERSLLQSSLYLLKSIPLGRVRCSKLDNFRCYCFLGAGAK